jgi:hypothetical protein
MRHLKLEVDAKWNSRQIPRHFKISHFRENEKKAFSFQPFVQFLAMLAHLHCINEKKKLHFPVQLLAFRFSFELSNCVVA